MNETKGNKINQKKKEKRIKEINKLKWKRKKEIKQINKLKSKRQMEIK